MSVTYTNDIISGANRWVTTAEYCNYGGTGGDTWYPLEYRSGTVTCSSTSQVRWTCDINVGGAPFGDPRYFDKGIGDQRVGPGINPWTSRLRIRHGLARYGEAPRMVGMGLYAVTSVARATDGTNGINVKGESFEHYLIRSALTRAKSYRGLYADDILRILITQVLPNATIVIDSRVDLHNIVSLFTIERDRWAAIDGGADAPSLAKSAGARVYPDGDGIWQVAPTPSLQDDPVWQAVKGPGGVLMKQTESLDNTTVKNVTVVQGTPSGGAIIGPAIAQDTDPYSLTYANRSPDYGGFGYVPDEVYSSNLIFSTAQAKQVAQARLAVKLGLAQQITFDTVHDPSKAPGQVGIVRGFDTDQRVILDSVTYDLSPTPGPLQCQTRTTATRYAGDISDPSLLPT